jgi:hypothetical protein
MFVNVINGTVSTFFADNKKEAISCEMTSVIIRFSHMRKAYSEAFRTSEARRTLAEEKLCSDL